MKIKFILMLVIVLIFAGCKSLPNGNDKNTVEVSLLQNLMNTEASESLVDLTAEEKGILNSKLQDLLNEIRPRSVKWMLLREEEDLLVHVMTSKAYVVTRKDYREACRGISLIITKIHKLEPVTSKKRAACLRNGIWKV